MKNIIFILAALLFFIGVYKIGSCDQYCLNSNYRCVSIIEDSNDPFDGWSLITDLYYYAPLSGIGESKYWSITPWENCDGNCFIVTVYCCTIKISGRL